VYNLINKVLKIFADNNLFEEGVELIGSWCFFLYQKHLGAKKFPLKPLDIDFLIPNPFHGKKHLDFINQLKEFGFQHGFNRDGSLFLWNADLKIEFITPEKGKGSDNAIKIKNLGISAIPLRFMMLLLNNPIIIKDENISILVPNPTNFCLHKLIIAARRRKTDKSLKDLQQAICTSAIIDSKEIEKLFWSLPKKWRSTIQKTLGKAKQELPLYEEEINALELTLRNKNNVTL